MPLAAMSAAVRNAVPRPATAAARTAAAATAPAMTEKQLVSFIKRSYETAVKKGSDVTFKGEVAASPRTLKGTAHEAYREYSYTTKHGMINSGPPKVTKATVGGHKVFFVAGDVSDTGTEFGFYTSEGKLLAKAYSGQGMQPNRAGVDWF